MQILIFADVMLLRVGSSALTVSHLPPSDRTYPPARAPITTSNPCRVLTKMKRRGLTPDGQTLEGLVSGAEKSQEEFQKVESERVVVSFCRS